MDSNLTEIKDGVRCANPTNTQFQCEDHIDLIFEKLAKECGFDYGYGNIWTHLKDKNYAIQFNPNNNKIWVDYKFESKSKVIDTPSVSLFIDEVLSFIRDFYKEQRT